MSFDAHQNFAYSTVLTPPSPAASGTSLTVAAGEGANFPVAPFNCTVWPADAQATAANAEIIRVTAIVGDALTITRTQEGTSARTILAGDQIAETVTVRTFTDIEAAVEIVSNAVSVETSARGAAMNTVSNALSVEIATRATNESALLAAIDVVSTAAVTAEAHAATASAAAASADSHANTVSARAASISAEVVSLFASASAMLEGHINTVSAAVEVVSNAFSAASINKCDVSVTLGSVAFDIKLTPASCEPGLHSFHVKDAGFGHELLVMRTDILAADLISATSVPGGMFDEDAFDIRVDTGVLAHLSTVTQNVVLESGHYILACNMPGHTHLGMAVDFRVWDVASIQDRLDGASIAIGVASALATAADSHAATASAAATSADSHANTVSVRAASISAEVVSIAILNDASVSAVIKADALSADRAMSTVLKADLASVSAVIKADAVSADTALSAVIKAEIASVSAAIKTDIGSVSAAIRADEASHIASTSATIKADIASVSAVITGSLNTVSNQVSVNLSAVTNASTIGSIAALSLAATRDTALSATLKADAVSADTALSAVIKADIASVSAVILADAASHLASTSVVLKADLTSVSAAIKTDTASMDTALSAVIKTDIASVSAAIKTDTTSAINVLSNLASNWVSAAFNASTATSSPALSNAASNAASANTALSTVIKADLNSVSAAIMADVASHLASTSALIKTDIGSVSAAIKTDAASMDTALSAVIKADALSADRATSTTIKADIASVSAVIWAVSARNAAGTSVKGIQSALNNLSNAIVSGALAASTAGSIAALSNAISNDASVSAAIFTAAGIPQFKAVTGAQAVTSTFAQKVSGLSLSIAANGVYNVHGQLIWTVSGAASASAVMQFGMSINQPPTQAVFQITGNKHAFGASIAITSINLQFAGVGALCATPSIMYSTRVSVTSGTPVNATLLFDGLIVAGGTGGLLKVVVGASTTTNMGINIIAGSYIRCFKVG